MVFYFIVIYETKTNIVEKDETRLALNTFLALGITLTTVRNHFITLYTFFAILYNMVLRTLG